MAATSTRLKDQSQLSSTSPTAIVTNPANTTTSIKIIRFYNLSATQTVSITLYRVPDSSGSLGTPTSAHTFDTFSITPLTAAAYQEWLILEDTNDAIFAQASIANVINYSADGLQESLA
jgi:hypothetical protein